MSGPGAADPRPVNRLAGETSPYLLQHAHNPVDWYPWCEEAFERARREDKPVLLSVGYAACHWCHVMEHESFEDPSIAGLMNDHFVCIKVDREERPDIDEIYMSAVQAMTGHGGWPMTVFLTPAGKPFYGGTYFPPADRYGMPGFPAVLTQLSSAYRQKRVEVDRAAAGWSIQLEHASAVPARGGARPLTQALVDSAADRMAAHFDPAHGGFGGPPKFPHSMDLSLFMRVYRRLGRLDLLAQVRKSLEAMAAGGIYDQLGGGFHRYSVDERWAVPHFEKMLYDNALLARTYVEAYQLTGHLEYSRVARETLDYVLAEMRDPAGGFWSSQDADSEGEEGKFFVWDPDEVKAVLGAADAEVFCACHGVTRHGNFEGAKTVLLAAKTAADYSAESGREAASVRETLQRSRRKLLAARAARERPATDDKVLASWNGLMISALARAARPLREPRYLEAAAQAADFILARMTTPQGRLLRSYRAGHAKLPAYLEDHGAVIVALADLYEASFETRWLQKARQLCSVMLERFWDRENGGFHFTADDHEELIARTKPFHDGATPSGNSLAVMACLRLARLTGDRELAARAERTLGLFAPLMADSPSGLVYMLTCLDEWLTPPEDVVVVGDPSEPATRALLDSASQGFEPGRAVLLLRPERIDSEDEKLVPALAGKRLVGGKPAAYVCRNLTCREPVTEPAILEHELGI